MDVVIDNVSSKKVRSEVVFGDGRWNCPSPFPIIIKRGIGLSSDQSDESSDIPG